MTQGSIVGIIVGKDHTYIYLSSDLDLEEKTKIADTIERSKWYNLARKPLFFLVEHRNEEISQEKPPIVTFS